MLADERGEYLHHRRVVLGGVAGHPLEGVDAADAHVELVRAELLDGLGVAVGHLALLGQLERAPGQGEVQRREDQGPGGEQARGERQEPSPGGVPCRLQQRRLGRADVMMREPVRERHEQGPHDRGRQHDGGDPCQPSDTRWPGRPALQHTQTLDGTGPRRSAVLRFRKSARLDVTRGAPSYQR